MPAIAGLQEMCLRDLADVQKRLQDRTDEDEPNANIRWRSSFRRTISTGNCPDAEGPRGRQFGIATIRNVVVTAGESRRYRESAQDPRINPASGRRVEARAYIRQQIDVQGRDVEFFNTHLIDDRAYVRPGGELPVQRLQSRRLLELAQGVNTPRAAVGDFNNHPNSELVGDWLSDFRDVDRCRGDNRFPECDELTAGAERIDYIFTRGMGINDANVANVDEGTSDHDSLVASTQVE